MLARNTLPSTGSAATAAAVHLVAFVLGLGSGDRPAPTDLFIRSAGTHLDGPPATAKHSE
jgi:hypothetical protein